MSDSSPHQQQHCLNCHAQLGSGNYCANCGQEVKEIRRPFLFLLKDGVRAVFELDGRAYRTLFYLLSRPGFLTKEYVSGRRMSYTPPLRLFLVISIGFFLSVSAATSLQSIRESMNADSAAVELPVAINEPADADDDDDTDTDADPAEQILEFINGFSIPFVDEARNEDIRRVMRSRSEENLDEIRTNPSAFFFDSLDYITVFILMMMPILAFIQKLLYLRSGRFYVEHLILTLHNHAFLILAIFINMLVGLIADLGIPVIQQVASLTGMAISLWIVAYLFLSLRYFFGQGFGITLLKFATMAVTYTVVTAIGIFYFAAVIFFVF